MSGHQSYLVFTRSFTILNINLKINAERERVILCDRNGPYRTGDIGIIKVWDLAVARAGAGAVHRDSAAGEVYVAAVGGQVSVDQAVAVLKYEKLGS